MATVIGTRKAELIVDSVDVTAEVSKVAITTGEKDSDFMSFAEALAGGARDYKLVMTLRQDTASASLWYQIWAHLGEDVDVEFWPNGGSGGSPSATLPKFSGTVTIMEPDGDLLGGEANKSTTAVMTTEVEWVFTAKPTLTIA